MTKQAKQPKQPIRKQGNNAITRFTRNSSKKKKETPTVLRTPPPARFFAAELPNPFPPYPLQNNPSQRSACALRPGGRPHRRAPHPCRNCTPPRAEKISPLPRAPGWPFHLQAGKPDPPPGLLPTYPKMTRRQRAPGRPH